MILESLKIRSTMNSCSLWSILAAKGWLSRNEKGAFVHRVPLSDYMDIVGEVSLTTATAQSEIYAFFFDQKGLMGGLGLQGTKITKINK
jgi:hypothetical protein